MNCAEFEREWQELDDPSVISPEMDEHLQACTGCAQLVREINLLRWEGRQLMETEEPPSRVWANIRSELGREGVLREPGARSWLHGILGLAWLARLPLGVAYAAVFFLALVGVEFLRDQVSPPAVPVTASATASPSAALVAQEAAAPEPTRAADQAEATSVASAQAASEEERVFQHVIEKAPPDRRAVLVGNWQQLNDAVDESARFLNEHPDDPLAIENLFMTQQQRTHFVGTVIRMEEF